METCYKVFRREVIQSIKLESNRFGFEPEVTAKLAHRGYRIYEVPISYHGREYWEGKKINWKDGFSAIWTILKYGVFSKTRHEPRGYLTLKRMSGLKNYNDWLWNSIRSHVGERVLEVGAGIGNMTRYLYGRELVFAADREVSFFHILRNKFRRKPGIVVDQIDLDSDASLALAEHRFDSVVCLNVLEHVDDDVAALRRLHAILQPGGTIAIYAPAGQNLYGSLDEGVGHKRRYSKEDVEEKLRAAGFEVDRAYYLNRFGRIGWFMNSRVLGRKEIPFGQARFFDMLVPAFRVMEKTPPSRGLSVIALAHKPGAATDER
jgi:SAM-dependent methyltransferase